MFAVDPTNDTFLLHHILLLILNPHWAERVYKDGISLGRALEPARDEAFEQHAVRSNKELRDSGDASKKSARLGSVGERLANFN